MLKDVRTAANGVSEKSARLFVMAPCQSGRLNQKKQDESGEEEEELTSQVTGMMKI